VLDLRLATVDSRLEGAKRIIAVTGGKGGIGKSLVSSALALVLADQGQKTGLLDLDLTGPTDHIILGFETGFPSEEISGIDPPVLHGIKCMSIAHFAKESPAPMRGEDVTNALLELLAITRWGELDTLVIDMPPGLGDATLDTVRLLKRAEYLIVSTDSKVVVETVRKTLGFLTSLRRPIAGVIENMRRRDSTTVADLAASFGVPLLGALPYDEDLEDATGDAKRLLKTEAVHALRSFSI
jgi:ATP-binding protein involved in chromosome partitioning